MLLFELFKNPLYFVAFLIALVIGITIHEYAHAWMATRSGDNTAKYSGRLTLNPLAHLDPMGTLFLFLVGFGWGKPVPINPNFFKKKEDELKVAFAGIVTNLLFALIVAIPIRVALINGQTIESSTLLSFLNIIVDINLVLATFNLLPVFPLDGSHLVEYFLPPEARYNFQQYGPYILFGVILMDRIVGTNILITIMEPVLRLFSFLVKGVFTTII